MKRRAFGAPGFRFERQVPRDEILTVSEARPALMPDPITWAERFKTAQEQAEAAQPLGRHAAKRSWTVETLLVKLGRLLTGNLIKYLSAAIRNTRKRLTMALSFQTPNHPADDKHKESRCTHSYIDRF